MPVGKLIVVLDITAGVPVVPPEIARAPAYPCILNGPYGKTPAGTPGPPPALPVPAADPPLPPSALVV